jgi:hypothetical protein
MAKANKNAIVQGLSGSIGDMVFRQMPDGSTRVSRKPDFSRRVFSPGQKEHQSRFQQAVAYAREAAKTQPIYAELARGTAKTAYNWALSDWFNPPIIGRIERRKGRIKVQANDNVLVTKVWVKIMDEEGKVLEQGEARQANAEWWEYPSGNTEGTIEATAWDLAGNRTKFVL